MRCTNSTRFLTLSMACIARTRWRYRKANGRTARAVSYAALCIRVGYRLPGESTIPAQIATDKRPYYEALEAADRAYADGKIDVSKLEEMIGTMLAKQFLEVHTAAMGGSS